LTEATAIQPAPNLMCQGVPVADTFAEAFPIVGARLVITAASEDWARTAGAEFCGFASSVIACDVEAAVERAVSPAESPDGRPGVSVLVFAFSREGLSKSVAARVGQCILRQQLLVLLQPWHVRIAEERDAVRL